MMGTDESTIIVEQLPKQIFHQLRQRNQGMDLKRRKMDFWMDLEGIIDSCSYDVATLVQEKGAMPRDTNMRAIGIYRYLNINYH